jgi:hypothetical protein
MDQSHKRGKLDGLLLAESIVYAEAVEAHARGDVKLANELLRVSHKIISEFERLEPPVANAVEF